MPDFKKVAQIPIEPVCAWLGIELKNKGAHLRGQCPICDHPSERAFSVTPKIGRWWCFGRCKSGGDVIELVAQVNQVSHYEATKQLAAHFGLP